MPRLTNQDGGTITPASGPPAPRGAAPAGPGGLARRDDRRGPAASISARRWPLVASSLMLALGVLYLLGWGPWVLHVSGWTTGGDLWGIFRGAHYVGWGYLGGVYDGSTGVVSFPGMEILLAPVAMLSGALHLSESFPPFFVAHPTAALVLAPIEMALASTAVFAADGLAERLGVGRRRRAALAFAVAAVAWPVAAVWGHAEDMVALALALAALSAMLEGRWTAVGWLLCFGIVMQPLVALAVPVLIGAAPAGQRMLLTLRSAALSGTVLALALLGNPSGTLRIVAQQPTPPSLNHATPWVAFAPVVSPAMTVHTSLGGLVRSGFRGLAGVAPVLHQPASVSGGAGRMIDVVLALLLGVVVWRRPQAPLRIVWLVAVVFASRCFFEAVMTPYYLAPPLVLLLVLAARREVRRFGASVAVAVEVTVFSYRHLSPWAWWLPMAAGLLALVALAYPERPIDARRPASVEGEDDRSSDDRSSDARPAGLLREPLPA